MQTIDPIKPLRPIRDPRPRIVDPGPPPSPRGPGRQVIDGFVAPPPRPQPVVSASVAPRHLTTTPLQPTVHPRQSPPPWHQPESPKKDTSLQTPFAPTAKPSYSLRKKIMVGSMLAAIAVVAAILVYVPFGQVLALLYGIVVLVKRIPSRTTFLLALVTLALVPITLLLFGAQNLLSSALATNAYILLVIGVITLAIELRKDSAAPQTL